MRIRIWAASRWFSTAKLTVAIHRESRSSVDRTLEHLFAKLNEMEIVFLGTELTLHYQLVGSNPDHNSKKVSLPLHRDKEF